MLMGCQSGKLDREVDLKWQLDNTFCADYGGLKKYSKNLDSYLISCSKASFNILYTPPVHLMFEDFKLYQYREFLVIKEQMCGDLSVLRYSIKRRKKTNENLYMITCEDRKMRQFTGNPYTVSAEEQLGKIEQLSLVCPPGDEFKFLSNTSRNNRVKNKFFCGRSKYELEDGIDLDKVHEIDALICDGESIDSLELKKKHTYLDTGVTGYVKCSNGYSSNIDL